jgi:hypothetical protein
MTPFIDNEPLFLLNFLNHRIHPKRVTDKAISSSYSKLLNGPIATIAGNVPERADANSSAILGYN